MDEWKGLIYALAIGALVFVIALMRARILYGAEDWFTIFMQS